MAAAAGAQDLHAAYATSLISKPLIRPKLLRRMGALVCKGDTLKSMEKGPGAIRGLCLRAR